MTQLTTVTIQLCMTIEIPGCLPTRIYRRVPIVLGRTLQGTPMLSLFDALGTQHEGVAEVDLTLEAVESLAPLCTQLSLAITHLSPNGVLKTSETYSKLLPSSRAYKQLKLLEAEYMSEN